MRCAHGTPSAAIAPPNSVELTLRLRWQRVALPLRGAEPVRPLGAPQTEAQKPTGGDATGKFSGKVLSVYVSCRRNQASNSSARDRHEQN